MATPQPSQWSQVLLSRPKRSCRRISIGCLLLFVLLFGGLCALFSLWLTPAEASSPDNFPPRPLHVWLLIDNSNSMYEMGGVGSDPDLLRLDAARLFLTYLGVDEPALIHQAGVIFFGSEAHVAVPLSRLTNDAQRAALLTEIVTPTRLGWTDHLTALQLAQAEIERAEGDGRSVIVLLTDGKPELSGSPLPVDAADYRDALQAQSDQFRQAGVPLFLILLANEATDNDRTIAGVWQPLWQSMSQATPPGRFFTARSAADLPDIYHRIVVALTGRESEGVVLSTTVSDMVVETLSVPSGLVQLTLVISKSDPAQKVTIETATGETLTPDSPLVRRAGQSQETPEEVWVVDQPVAGNWTVRIEGAGQVTIWQDYKSGSVTAVPATALPTALSTTPTPAISLALPTAGEPTGTPARPPATTLATPSPTPSVTAATTQTAVLTSPVLTPTVVPQTDSPSARRWPLWLLGASLLLAGLAGGLFGLYRMRQPRLSGSLRVLAENGRLPKLVELDTRRQTAVTIGKPPADIPLPGSVWQATIRPGLSVNGAPQMILEGPGELTVNDVPLSRPTPLFDMATIDLGGGVRIRYEDLRLRRTARQNGWSASQKRAI
ncbi:MAG: VWA domain-containing protein [Chloroflexi bacterium]|nr:VWA domain-containing protein [Chloroflexota bacterium]